MIDPRDLDAARDIQLEIAAIQCALYDLRQARARRLRQRAAGALGPARYRYLAWACREMERSLHALTLAERAVRKAGAFADSAKAGWARAEGREPERD